MAVNADVEMEDVVAEQHAEGDTKRLSGRRKKAAKAKQVKPGSFENMGLSIPILKAIKRKGFQLPTPIQRKTIPLILQGVDVVGMAMTGSGKTGAFVIPIVHKLSSHEAAGVRAVLLAPARELALQTYKVVTEIAKHTDLRSAVLVGGDSMAVQFAELSASPDIIVATPGRLLHHLSEIPGFNLKNTRHVVLDEADRLFEMGLGGQVQDILKGTSETRQALLFSATLPAALADFAAAGLRSPHVVRLDTDTKLSPTLALAFFTLRDSDKPAALLHVVQEVLPSGSTTIVFVATKHRVEYLLLLLQAAGVQCCAVYGAMDQTARKISVGKLRAGKAAVMLVTDVAARGIDIPHVTNVLHYDFPPTPKLFVHRSGRAARAGRPGTSFSFVTAEDMPYAVDLHLFLSRPLTPVPMHGGAAAAEGASDGTSWLGAFPEALLDIAIEQARAQLALSPSMQSLAQSCENAFTLYRKTRPPASTESVRRARALGKPGPHPMLAEVAQRMGLMRSGATDAARAEITDWLKSFRPAATVLEAQVAANRKGEGAGFCAVPGVRSAGVLGNVVVMAQKRAAHSTSITAHHSAAAHRAATAASGAVLASDGDPAAAAPAAEAAAPQQPLGPIVPDIVGSGGTGRFRDAEFFVAAERADRHAEEGYAVGDRGRGALHANVLDLTGEDGAAAGGRRTVWDNKKKRYVTLQKNEAIKAGKRVKVKGAAGSTGGRGGDNGDGEAGAIYKKWLKSGGKKAALGSGGGAKGGASAMGDRFKHGGRGWTNEFKAKRANSGVRDDLKSEGEMRKAAQKKERMKAHLQAKAKVSKKQGKGKRR
eukprot:jgi/Ulvmu1/11414/UM075_0076.1